MAGSGREIAASLAGIPGARVKTDVALSRLTTWGVGGPASVLVDAGAPDVLREVILRLRDGECGVLVLGNGSNVLIADEGFDGAVVRLRGGLAGISIDGETVKAGAGVLLSTATIRAARSSLSGLEFAIGIPGTIGGAVMSNASTFAGSMAAIALEVRTMTLDGDERACEVLEDAYREPIVPEGQVVTSAVLGLRHGVSDEIRSLMREVRVRREETQPTGAATAGSVFKNPEGDSAGRLIEECGLKGRASGGAAISRVHANFIVNNGGASAADIKKLMDLAIREVADRFGVGLEPEVRLVGFEKES